MARSLVVASQAAGNHRGSFAEYFVHLSSFLVPALKCFGCCGNGGVLGARLRLLTGGQIPIQGGRHSPAGKCEGPRPPSHAPLCPMGLAWASAPLPPTCALGLRLPTCATLRRRQLHVLPGLQARSMPASQTLSLLPPVASLTPGLGGPPDDPQR